MSHTGWAQPMLVTLTATTNPYLAPRLPLRGLLQVHEMTLTGHPQPRAMSFLEVDAEGQPVGTRVAVDDAHFTYTATPPAPPSARPTPVDFRRISAADYARKRLDREGHSPFQFRWEELMDALMEADRTGRGFWQLTDAEWFVTTRLYLKDAWW